MKESQFDYSTDWEPYSMTEEPVRFLSNEEEELSRICDVVDLKKKKRPKTAGGIPIRYDAQNAKLYTLKEGPHALVEGESGSKKSRAVVRPKIFSAALNGDSMVLTDPKAELAQDPKIQALLKKYGYRTVLLDFRTFHGDGYNFLQYAFEQMRKGNASGANAFIDRFCNMLIQNKKTVDDFWNDSAADLIRFSLQILLMALWNKPDGLSSFHLASLKRWIRHDKETITEVISHARSRMPKKMEWNPVSGYYDILQMPEKTYSSVVSSASALLSDFCASDDLLRMVSLQTFDVRSLYRERTAVFCVIPDETDTYNAVAGKIFDSMYQILVETFTERFQDQTEQPCRIHFICDEAASMKIGDMASKISASRSRQIDWTMIYQSRKQMKDAYKDMDTIEGNARHRVFLGSSDYEILKTFSDSVGQTSMTLDGRGAPLVPVQALRQMRKTPTYKDALVVTGNFLYTARLPDYDTLPFPRGTERRLYADYLHLQDLVLYTPEQFLKDVSRGRIYFPGADCSEDDEESDLFEQFLDSL